MLANQKEGGHLVRFYSPSSLGPAAAEGAGCGRLTAGRVTAAFEAVVGYLRVAVRAALDDPAPMMLAGRAPCGRVCFGRWVEAAANEANSYDVFTSDLLISRTDSAGRPNMCGIAVAKLPIIIL